jgi:precorrin-2/cobalt-factor-2 C20-methyltransferase
MSIASSTFSESHGRLHGVGLGPGDPDLLTIRAVATVQASPVIAFFAKRGARGHGRTIVDRWLDPEKLELPLIYPVTLEIPFQHPDYIAALSRFYEESSALIAAHLSEGRDVALLCEGDPLFYGSFMHIYVRLKTQFRVSICPGVTGMSGCWTAAGEPIAWGDDVLTVLPGTLPRKALIDRLVTTDAAVIMKLGRNFAKVKGALAETGLLTRAIYVERGAMANQKIMPLIEKPDDEAPYFSMIIVPGQGRRP